jgi:hypothetical protein
VVSDAFLERVELLEKFVCGRLADSAVGVVEVVDELVDVAFDVVVIGWCGGGREGDIPIRTQGGLIGVVR